jgi:hypothetical protein
LNWEALVHEATNPFPRYWSSQLIIGHFSDSPKVVALSLIFVCCVFLVREDYLAAIQHLRAAFQPTGQCI